MNPVNYAIWAPTLVLVALRLAGMVMAGPVIGHSTVPIKLRAAAALVMSLAVVARMASPIVLPTSPAALLLVAGGELLIGASVGYAARLLLVGVQLGAFHIAGQMGLALAEVFNPLAEEAGGTIRSLLTLLAVAIFLLIGGHRALIGTLLRSFQTLPPAASPVGASLLETLVTMLAASFLLALKVAGPVLVTMLLASVALGILERTMPQSNLLSTHLPVRAMLGLVVLSGTLMAFEAPLASAVDTLLDRLTVLA